MVVALTEIMPVDVRTARFSLAYSLATGLIGITGNKAAPGWWMTFAAVCGLIATLALYRRRGVPDAAMV
jgi:MHS family citrate/tricarballylate:H+ symporter-like MFS transporter